jgi:CheY-like chemotaxis protein
VDLRDSLALLLRGAGYAVEVAANGLEGLNIVRTLGRPPALVLVDLIMPVMDGWQFCAELRRLDGGAAVPVVVLSGAWHLHSSRTRSVEATETVMKPIDFGRLLSIVGRCVGPARTVGRPLPIHR